MTKTFVLVGDSQAVGLAPHLQAALEARGWRLVGTLAGVGWSTVGVVSSGDAARLPPADVALVVLGGNDMPSSTYPARISELVGQLSARRKLWVGPAAVDVSARGGNEAIAERKAAIAEMQRAVLPRLDVRWIDGRAMTRDLQHAPDGLHFTRTAQQRWAERLAPVITKRASSWLAFGGGVAIAAFGFWLITQHRK